MLLKTLSGSPVLLYLFHVACLSLTLDNFFDRHGAFLQTFLDFSRGTCFSMFALITVLTFAPSFISIHFHKARPVYASDVVRNSFIVSFFNPITGGGGGEWPPASFSALYGKRLKMGTCNFVTFPKHSLGMLYQIFVFLLCAEAPPGPLSRGHYRTFIPCSPT